MNKIEKLADQIASWVFLYNDREQWFGKKVTKANLNYYLLNTFNNLGIVLVTFVAGLILNEPDVFIQTMCAFGLFRLFTGGRHMGSSLSCIVVSTLIIVTGALLPLPGYSSMLVSILTVIITYLYAPASFGVKAIQLPLERRRIYRIISFLLILVSLISDKNHIIAVLFIQSLTLIDGKPRKDGRRWRVD
ncbi:accessory gene regulator B family protein [Paenibacillus amylolyticus]|uniref:accessory gene regulator B family protein n=1 Tax=Paenibacillus amylolyticus TaxID=1451 RepID=UPI0033927DD3